VALWALLGIGLAALVVGVVVWQRSRPEVYKPGEKLEGITGNLERELPGGAPQPRFEDVTAASGLGGFRSFAGDRTSQLPEDMGSGAAFGDYDGDGDDDLFAVAAGAAVGRSEAERAASRLYENLGDGTFREVESFPDTRIQGMGAAFGDYDGDGDLDLVVTGYRTLRLFRNDDGSFTRVEDVPDLDGFWASPSWADFDADGDLDLYVCGYVRYREGDTGEGKTSRQFGAVVPYTLNPASYEPERNLLFRNDGGRFTEVAEKLGVDNPTGRSLSALWHDLDGDGRLELYVANDVSDNALLVWSGDRFEDASHEAFVADYRGAMGLAVGDWNRDGDDDMFVTHWIAQENALYDSLLVDLAPESGEPASLSFADQSALAGLGQPSLHRVGWGTVLADLDGDGWLDLIVANGSTMETDDEPKRLKPQAPFLFWSRGDFFHDLAPYQPQLAEPHVGRGLAVSDYDQDGDLDLLFVHLDGGLQLLRNDMQSGNWIELRLRSRPRRTGAGPGHAEGALAVVKTGELELRRSVSGASYLSQSTRTLHFGLGNASRVDGVEVHWPGGGVQSFEGLEVGAIWELTEGDEEARRAVASGGALGDRERHAAFWEAHRAGMRAMKRERNVEKAVGFFRKALALDPSHEDARYYLANGLATLGQTDEALDLLAELVRQNPSSHRGLKQWGTLRALTATTPEELAEAEEFLERARALNPEETGTLLALGELALLRGDSAAARERLEWACRTNPRAVGGFFLRAFLAWREGDAEASRALLDRARQARGDDWKPAGATAEGDVADQLHRDPTPLSAVWNAWDGRDATPTFESLEARLDGASSL